MSAPDVGSEARVAPLLPVGVEPGDADRTLRTRTATSDPTAAVQAMSAALDRMAVLADELAEQGDLPSLAAGLARIREYRKAVADVERHIEDYVAQLMPQDQVNLDDWLTLERRSGKTRRQWQSVELLRHLVGDQLIDARTGECVWDRLVACLPLTGSLSWRAGALREHGVDPGDWCEESAARTTVSVKAADDE